MANSKDTTLSTVGCFSPKHVIQAYEDGTTLCRKPTQEELNKLNDLIDKPAQTDEEKKNKAAAVDQVLKSPRADEGLRGVTQSDDCERPPMTSWGRVDRSGCKTSKPSSSEEGKKDSTAQTSTSGGTKTSTSNTPAGSSGTQAAAGSNGNGGTPGVGSGTNTGYAGNTGGSSTGNTDGTGSGTGGGNGSGGTTGGVDGDPPPQPQFTPTRPPQTSTPSTETTTDTGANTDLISPEAKAKIKAAAKVVGETTGKVIVKGLDTLNKLTLPAGKKSLRLGFNYHLLNMDGLFGIQEQKSTVQLFPAYSGEIGLQYFTDRGRFGAAIGARVDVVDYAVYPEGSSPTDPNRPMNTYRQVQGNIFGELSGSIFRNNQWMPDIVEVEEKDEDGRTVKDENGQTSKVKVINPQLANATSAVNLYGYLNAAIGFAPAFFTLNNDGGVPVKDRFYLTVQAGVGGNLLWGKLGARCGVQFKMPVPFNAQDPYQPDPSIGLYCGGVLLTMGKGAPKLPKKKEEEKKEEKKTDSEE